MADPIPMAKVPIRRDPAGRRFWSEQELRVLIRDELRAEMQARAQRIAKAVNHG